MGNWELSMRFARLPHDKIDTQGIAFVTSDSRPVIGLMLGDATGIGPEISVKVLASGAMTDEARLVVIGDVRVLRARHARCAHVASLTRVQHGWTKCPGRPIRFRSSISRNIDPAQPRARSRSPKNRAVVCGDTLKS